MIQYTHRNNAYEDRVWDLYHNKRLLLTLLAASLPDVGGITQFSERGVLTTPDYDFRVV